MFRDHPHWIEILLWWNKMPWTMILINQSEHQKDLLTWSPHQQYRIACVTIIKEENLWETKKNQTWEDVPIGITIRPLGLSWFTSASNNYVSSIECVSKIEKCREINNILNIWGKQIGLDYICVNSDRWSFQTCNNSSNMDGIIWSSFTYPSFPSTIAN